MAFFGHFSVTLHSISKKINQFVDPLPPPSECHILFEWALIYFKDSVKRNLCFFLAKLFHYLRVVEKCESQILKIQFSFFIWLGNNFSPRSSSSFHIMSNKVERNVHSGVCVCVCVCVCVNVCLRERELVSLCVCVLERERNRDI